MSTRVDALRNTLDHLALDPRASEDRRYLVSMLRRLGYSDAEIEAQIGPIGEPGRVIEVEYEPAERSAGPSARSRETTFQVAGPEEGLRFRLADDDVHAGAGVEEVHHTDLAGVESDLGDWGDFEQGPRDDFTSVDGDAPDDFGAWGDGGSGDDLRFQEEDEVVEFRAARRPDPAVAAGWREADADAWSDQTGAWGEDAEPGEEMQEMQWAPAQAGSWQEEAAQEDAWTDEPEAGGEELVPWPEPQDEAESWPEAGEPEATDAWPEEAGAETEPWPEAGEPGAADAWPEEAAEAETEPWPEADGPRTAEAHAWEDAAWEDAGEEPTTAPRAPYVHGEYTLYTREVHLSTGREQRIYFFAKSKPQSGQACPLPDGYEVIENDKTGLPFLRRQR